MFHTKLSLLFYLLFITLIRSQINLSCFIPKFTTTVKQLNVSQYLGVWYQVYGSIANSLFQGNGTCVTAKYDLISNNNISVLNSQINNNKLEQISGYVYQKSSSKPGQLTVKLDGVSEAPYWIINLGEVKNDKYQYSIVVSPLSYFFWILARNVTEYYTNYDNQVEEFLIKNKYNINCYYPINQTGCKCS